MRSSQKVVAHRESENQSPVARNTQKMALAAYRTLLRSARIAFEGMVEVNGSSMVAKRI